MVNTVSVEQGRTAGARQGIVLLLASVMPIMAIISLVPVLPLLLEEFGDVAGAEVLVPIALTIPALCVALLSPVAGWLADRVGRKRLLVAALLLYAGFGIIPWFLDDLMQIIAARVALGTTEAVIMTVATTLIGDYFEGERREKWIALQVAVGSLAAIALIAIGGGLGEVFGSRGPFLLYLLAIPVAFAAAAILFEPQVRQGRVDAGAIAFPYRAVLPLIATTLGVGILFYTVIVQLGPVLGLSGPVSPGMIGAIGAAANICVGLGTFIFNRLSAHAGPRLLTLGLVCAAAGYTGIALSGALLPIALFSCLVCIGSGILLPNMLTWTMRHLPAAMRGRGTGMWTGAFFLGQFLAPLMTVGVMRATGGLAPALLAYAAVIAAGAVLTAFLLNRQPQSDLPA
ncbi:MAG: MFS transporter [Verrucomicrobiales bacterium]|nr:MFS transporter [Verrucomicrobiales bacterium]